MVTWTQLTTLDDHPILVNLDHVISVLSDGETGVTITTSDGGTIELSAAFEDVRNKILEVVLAKLT